MVGFLKKNLARVVVLTVFCVITISFTFNAYKPILGHYFFNDDWPLLWGIYAHKGFPLNVFDVFWNFFDSAFVVRVGVLPIWLTWILYRLFEINPYPFHLFSLAIKIISSVSLVFLAWKISKNFLIGVLAGLIFTLTFSGSLSVTWFIHNSVYILSIATLIITFILVRFTNRYHYLWYIIAIALTNLMIYLYSPRAHALAVLPFALFIWAKKPFTRKNMILVVCYLLIIFGSFRLFYGGSASQESTKVLYSLRGALTTIDKPMHFTYPLSALSYSFINKSLVESLPYVPAQPIQIAGQIYLTQLRFWVVLVFPILWTLISFAVVKSSTFGKKQVFFYLLGIIWLGVNVLLRRGLFSAGWIWHEHFIFILSGFLTLYAVELFFLFRNHKVLGSISKLLLFSVFITLAAYFVNWAFDPMFPPTLLDYSRYISMSAYFGSMVFATTIYSIYYLLSTKIKSTSLSIAFPTLCIVTIGLFFNYYMKSNLKDFDYYFNGLIKNDRSYNWVKYTHDFVNTNTNIGKGKLIILFDLNEWNIYEAQGAYFVKGHALALINRITDPEMFPVIYLSPDKIYEDITNYCKYKHSGEYTQYLFRYNKGRLVDESFKFPKVDCPIPKTPI